MVTQLQTCSRPAAVVVATGCCLFVAQNVAHHTTVFWGVHWSQTLLRFIQHLPPSSQLESRKAVCNPSCCSAAHGLCLSVCLSSVCLHANTINTVLPPMHTVPNLLRIVLDDGTKRFSSNRQCYSWVCTFSFCWLASPQQFRTQSGLAACDLWNIVGCFSFLFLNRFSPLVPVSV